MREQAAREREVVRVRRLARERVGEERDEVGLGARLELARRRELLLDRADLVREPEQVEVADVLRPDERDRRAGAARAAGAAGAVHVLLGRLGEVVVDDVREVRDVDAARGDVGRDEEAELALARRAP